MKLTGVDKDSPLWRNLKIYFASEIDRLRAANDNARLSETETARLRGMIAVLKSLSDLDKPAPQDGPGTA